MHRALKTALIGLALSLQVTSGWGADPERIDKPAVPPGTSWRVRVVDGMTKVSLSETTYRMGATADGEIQLLTDNGEVGGVLDATSYAVKRGGDFVFDPPLERVRYPMAPGDRWQSSYSYNSPSAAQPRRR